MDEETAAYQKHNAYAVMCQHELWWHDLLLLVDAVESNDNQAWIWADYIWHHQEEFLRPMPKAVVQSNWYYGPKFHGFTDDKLEKVYVDAYHVLDQHGYQQIPTMSNHESDISVAGTVEYCKQHVSEKNLLGFLMTPWRITLEIYRDRHIAALGQVAAAKERYG